MTNREAIRQLRKDNPDTWGKFTQANLERRFYEARKLARTALEVRELLDQYGITDEILQRKPRP